MLEEKLVMVKGLGLETIAIFSIIGFFLIVALRAIVLKHFGHLFKKKQKTETPMSNKRIIELEIDSDKDTKEAILEALGHSSLDSETHSEDIKKAAAPVNITKEFLEFIKDRRNFGFPMLVLGFYLAFITTTNYFLDATNTEGLVTVRSLILGMVWIIWAVPVIKFTLRIHFPFFKTWEHNERISDFNNATPETRLWLFVTLLSVFLYVVTRS